MKKYKNKIITISDKKIHLKNSDIILGFFPLDSEKKKFRDIFHKFPKISKVPKKATPPQKPISLILSGPQSPQSTQSSFRPQVDKLF